MSGCGSYFGGRGGGEGGEDNRGSRWKSGKRTITATAPKVFSDLTKMTVIKTTMALAGMMAIVKLNSGWMKWTLMSP